MVYIVSWKSKLVELAASTSDNYNTEPTTETMTTISHVAAKKLKQKAPKHASSRLHKPKYDIKEVQKQKKQIGKPPFITNDP